MNSLFTKILISLVITVLIALAVVVLMTRVNMNRGLIQYIERQETAQLSVLVPELTELYQRNGNWDFVTGSPRAWNRLLRVIRGGADDIQRPPPRPFQGPPPEHRAAARVAGNLRARLFLLDENRQHIAGAPAPDDVETLVQPVEVNGTAVGWLGFTPIRNALPPEARLFLAGQWRALMISLLVALIASIGLGLLLARHFSRLLKKLESTVNTLSAGNYDARAAVFSGDEIGRLATGVNHLARTLAENRTARRRWMADIAHELRTPVSVLKGEIEAVQDGLRPADAHTMASLAEEAEHLSSLVSDLQTLALADAGALDFHMQPFSLGELIEQELRTFEGRFTERGIRVDSELPERLNFIGDARRIKQLLHNLLENGCRYTERDGRIELALKSGRDRLELLIDDSGPGLAAEQMSRLFDRFYRAEGSRARASGGSGLGLSICRNIVEAHRGEIVAEASPLGGLRIRVTLPLKAE